MTSARKVRPAKRPSWPKPCPRNPQRGRQRKPDRYSGGIRIAACTAMPRVALPASTQIISGVQADASSWRPHILKKTISPAIATTLLATGAQP